MCTGDDDGAVEWAKLKEEGIDEGALARATARDCEGVGCCCRCEELRNPVVRIGSHASQNGRKVYAQPTPPLPPGWMDVDENYCGEGIK